MTEHDWALQLEAAERRLSGLIRPTPARSHPGLNEQLQKSLVYKDEGAQLTGSFKIRGAYNALMRLNDGGTALGVITYSSGNFGKALAYAAAHKETTCVVVASAAAPIHKLRGIADAGGELVLHDRSEDRAGLTARLARERGLAFISPYDDPMVIAGQGTVACELLRDASNLDAVVVPVSGGGLLAGCAIAAHVCGSGTRVFGVEAAAVPRMSRSLRRGRRVSVIGRPTVADALRVNCPGEVTFPIISSLVEDVVVVHDDELLAAMAMLRHFLGMCCEPSAAAPIAALLARRLPDDLKHVGVVLTGSNIARNHFDELLQHLPAEDGYAASSPH